MMNRQTEQYRKPPCEVTGRTNYVAEAEEAISCSPPEELQQFAIGGNSTRLVLYPGLPRLLSFFILQAIKAWGGLGTKGRVPMVPSRELSYTHPN